MGALSDGGYAKQLGRPTLVLGHEALMTLARKVCAAAADADLEHLKVTAREFEGALVDHFQDEIVSMHGIPPADERILRRGQERLWSAVTELLWDADHGCPHPGGYCSSLAEVMLALLMLQAHDESRALRNRVA